MDKNIKQLTEHVKQQLAEGHTEGRIRQILRQHEWNDEAIDEALAAAKASPSHSDSVAATADHRGKYKLFAALGDTFSAVRNNLATVLLAGLVSIAVAAVSLIAMTAIATLMAKDLTFSEEMDAAVVLGVIVVAVLYVLWYAFSYTFVLAATSLAVNAGAEGRKSTLGVTLRRGLDKAGRVLGANLMVLLVALAPLLGVAAIGLVMFQFDVDSSAIGVFLSLASIVGVIWLVAALIRFALAPYVALFEADVPVKQTLQRSYQLLKGGGQWFIVKGFLLILLVSFFVSAMTGESLSESQASESNPTNIFSIIATFVANGVMVLLYRNRKKARK